MSRLNFDGLSESQIVVLAEIACGARGQGVLAHTMRSLVRRELLVEYVRRDGGFRWIEYQIPTHVYAEFCAWCAEKAAV